MVDADLAVAPLTPSARALPGARQGSCRGTAVVPGKAFAGGSCGSPRQGSRRGSPSSGPHLISYIYGLDKDLHATTEVPPEPWSQRSWLGWNPWAQGWLALLVLSKFPRQGSCRGRGGRPGKGLAWGVHLAPFALCVSGLGVASDRLVPLASLRLLSPALLSVAMGAAPTVRAQVKG